MCDSTHESSSTDATIISSSITRGVISLKILAYGRGGLTDDFDAFDKRESEHPVGFEVASRSASRKFDRVVRSVEHVAKPE